MEIKIMPVYAGICVRNVMLIHIGRLVLWIPVQRYRLAVKAA